MIRGPGRPFRRFVPRGHRPPAAARPRPGPRARSAGCGVCVLSRALRPSQLAAGERNMTLYAPGSSFQRLPLQPSPLHRFISLAPAPRLHDPTTVPDPGPAERREE